MNKHLGLFSGRCPILLMLTWIEVCVYAFYQTDRKTEVVKEVEIFTLGRKWENVAWRPHIPPGLSQSRSTGPGKTLKSDK